jgi:hypothetical protein
MASSGLSTWPRAAGRFERQHHARATARNGRRTIAADVGALRQAQTLLHSVGDPGSSHSPSWVMTGSISSLRCSTPVHGSSWSARTHWRLMAFPVGPRIWTCGSMHGSRTREPSRERLDAQILCSVQSIYTDDSRAHLCRVRHYYHSRRSYLSEIARELYRVLLYLVQQPC